MPSSTIWLKIGEHDVRCFKNKVGNALAIKDQQVAKRIDDKPTRSIRTVVKSHWELIGTGEELAAQTILRDAKGKEIELSAARFIVEKTGNLDVNEKSEVVDKKLEQFFVVLPDGSLGEEAIPYLPTERIEIKDDVSEVVEQGQGYWIPSTVIEGFLIQEVYELPVADARNDIKLFKDAEDAAKRDEIAILTYSNGGFQQYYAFLVPFFKDGKFEWQLKISDRQMEYRCLHDVPAPAAALREVKTLEKLPPIQALLTVATAKKKR
jgi:hypothetical protein